jgi:hypothetical protein
MKVLLGKIDNENIYLTKHTWDCDWYWGFGYVGNRNQHFHIDSLIKGEFEVNKIFSETTLKQETWWIIRDLFIQAYGLKKAAEIYRYGGHQTTVKGLTDLLRNQDKADQLNADLGILLDVIWSFIVNQLETPLVASVLEVA